MTRKIVISIINYRTADLTVACVESVLADLGQIDAQVVIVDNLSRDGSAERINAWIAEHPQAPVRLVLSQTNSGFSGGHNQAIATVAAEYYLVLNSDAILRPGFFAHLLAVADRTPKAGLIAPRIETEEGTTQVSRFRFHSPQSELIRGAATGPVTKILAKHTVAIEPGPDEQDAQWASFACILLRADMVADIGLMDEGYFLYFEDCEYCLRARRNGWQIALADKAVIVHFRGGSGPVKSLEKARKRLPQYYYASRTRFFRQAYGPLGPILGNMAWGVGRFIAHLRCLMAKPIPSSLHKERTDLWTNAASPLRPQRESENSRV